MPTALNDDGTVTVTGMYNSNTSPPPLLGQKAEADAALGRDAHLVECRPYDHQPNGDYTHESIWR